MGYVGPKVDLSYDYDHLGDSVDVIKQLADGSHPFFKQLASAKNPMVILGSELLQRGDSAVLFAQIQKLCEAIRAKSGCPDDWKVLNVLHRVASQVAALDLGYSAGVSNLLAAKPEVVYLMGADAGAVSRSDLPKDAFVIYQGHHGDAGAEIADCVLPGAAYTEKQATYVNMEGRAQQTIPALSPPGMARQDWKIIRAISEVVGETLPYDNLQEIRQRLTEVAPNLTRYGLVEEANFFKESAAYAQKSASAKAEGKIDVSLKVLEDYYMTNSISKASPTMAKCVQAVKAQKQAKYLKS